MNADVLEVLLAESVHARRTGMDPELEALFLAVLLEDVLQVTFTDEQIASGALRDPDALRAWAATSTPPG